LDIFGARRAIPEVMRLIANRGKRRFSAALSAKKAAIKTA